MPQPKATYPGNTTFGHRITEHMAEKNRVAEHVVQTFLGEGSSVFIGDGSSTFYVGLSIFDKALQTTIWTNHLAIAHEFPLWASGGAALDHTDVWMAGGEVEKDLMMTCGEDADSYAEKWARKAQNVVLSVKYLFAEHGPAGMEQKSLSIKQSAVRAVLQTGGKVIFLADHFKMTWEYKNQPLVFPSAHDWDLAMHHPSVSIVTTRHPNARIPEQYVPEPKNGVEWYEHHRWILSRAMKGRFVAV